MSEDIILRATSKDLLSPDWSSNLTVCDIVNESPESEIVNIVEIVKHRLNNKNRKICYLALILVESMMKNCGPPLYKTICSKDFLDYMSSLARGKKGDDNQNKALEMIQSWAFSFKSIRDDYPLFGRLYGALQSVPIEFPPEDQVNIIQINNITPSTKSSQVENPNESPYAKLENDVNILVEHLNLLEDLYLGGEYEINKSMILDENDFLLQCKDRMQDLILAGSYGLFPDTLYELILQSNDRVQLLLSVANRPSTAMDQISKMRTDIASRPKPSAKNPSPKKKTTHKKPKDESSDDSDQSDGSYSSSTDTSSDEEIFFKKNVTDKAGEKTDKNRQFPPPAARKMDNDSDSSDDEGQFFKNQADKSKKEKSDKSTKNANDLLDEILNS